MDFEVDRTDFRRTRVVDDPPPALADGQIRLDVERFAFTANNISYALSGDMLGYWDFFATEAPWGRLPVMGLSTVSESANADIETGGRYFGFSPMSTDVVIDARATRHGFRDIGTHRADHAPVYTDFESVAEDPGFREDRIDEYLLLRGVFMTSFLVDDYLQDNGHAESQTLVTSASSKTSIALAHCLAARGRAGVGITSARNLAFVESLGLYDSLVTYDDIETLDATTPSVVVDMAGSADVTGRIHHHFATALGYSCQVGATHWEEVGGPASDLPGPTPEFFFAPGQLQKRNQDWGPGELTARIAKAFGAFLDDAPRWLSVQQSAGPDDVTSIYLEMLEGNASPDTGHILSLSPNAFDD